MAWCPHCNQDRPIQRLPLTGPCPHCGQPPIAPHHPDCRGPVPGFLDACTFCNTPVFAKAPDARTYELSASREAEIVKTASFIDSNATPFEQHGLMTLPPEKAAAISNLIKSGQKIQAIKEFREAVPSFGLAEAKDAVEAIERQLGLAPPTPASATSTTKGCAGMLLLIPGLLTLSYLLAQL